MSRALDAHSGIERWNTFGAVHATIIGGRQLWAMEGTSKDAVPPEMKVATKFELPKSDSAGLRRGHLPVLIVHPLSGDGPCAVRRQTGERRIDFVRARRKTAVYEKKL